MNRDSLNSLIEEIRKGEHLLIKFKKKLYA